MAGRNHYTVPQIIAALHEADGYVSKTASLLGCSVKTIYNYRDRYPTVANTWSDIKEQRHDFVENSLHRQIKAGNVTAIIFYLKTQAQSRGYVEKQKVENEIFTPDDRAINVRIKIVEDD